MAKSKFRLLRIILVPVLIVSAGFILFFAGILVGLWGNVPSKNDLKDVNNHLASEVYSEDGTLLGKYFFENRSNVSFDEIPQAFIDALIATEDVRFFEHEGIDNRSLFRVLFKTILLGDKSSGGGSTISQQLIKNLYPRSGSSAVDLSLNKFKEMIAAKRLEDIYTKDEILTLYLNTVPFGDNTFGIESAADHYFSKALNELKIQEIAVLVGMLKGTFLYNPYYNPDNALNRRNVVLDQMQKYEYLEPTLADSLMKLPLVLDYKLLSHHSGTAPYFRERVRQKMTEWCKTHKKENGEAYDLYRDGLKIYTTLDAQLQNIAEKSVSKHMKILQTQFDKHWKRTKPWTRNTSILQSATDNSSLVRKLKANGANPEQIDSILHTPVRRKMFSWNGEQELSITPFDSIMKSLMILHTGVLAMEPDSGKIRCWIGGINHKFFQYDHVLARRQVGSTFKPVVYATALSKGIKPDDFYKNDSIVYEEYDNWIPYNSDRQFGGEYSVLGALVNSVNTVSVQLAMECGLNNVLEMASDLGIQTPLPAVPSIALGTAEIPLLEMVTAYAPFINGGYRVEPIFISRIEDRNGKVLDVFHPVERVKVLDRKNALRMTRMLKMVVDSGTAKSLRTAYGLNVDLAGKTGTTQNNADGWFIGCSQELIAGVWVGAENPAIHFRTTSLGQGAHMALPIYANMVQASLDDDKAYRYFNSFFPMPDKRIQRELGVPLYRDKASATDKLERLIIDIGDLISGKPKSEKDSTKQNKGLLDRIFNIFKKKK